MIRGVEFTIQSVLGRSGITSRLKSCCFRAATASSKFYSLVVSMYLRVISYWSGVSSYITYVYFIKLV